MDVGVAVADAVTAFPNAITVLAVFLHPFPSVPSTVTVVLAVGVDVTDVPVVAERPALLPVHA